MIFQLTFSGSATNLINALQQYGFIDLVIPFALIFAVLFAILEKVQIFGTEAAAKKYNTIISIAIALLIVIPHVLSPSPTDVVSVMNKFLPEFVFIALALLILLMLVGLLGGSKEATSGALVIGIAAVIAVIYLALVILNAVTPTAGLPAFLSDPNFQAIVIVILVLGLVIYYINRDETQPKFDLGAFFKKLFGG